MLKKNYQHKNNNSLYKPLEMRPSLKDQASQNANKWAQQRKDQLERSRQNSRERTNFAALGDIAIGGTRGSSAQRTNMNSQERQKQQAPTPKSLKQIPPSMVPTPVVRNQPQKPSSQQKPPQQQNQSEPGNQLRLLKHKMSTGSTNSRQGQRNEFQNDKEVSTINQHKSFSPSNEWDEKPIKGRTDQNSYQNESRNPPNNKLEPIAKSKNQPQTVPRNNRAGSSKHIEDENNNYQVNKKPPLQGLQKKNSNNYDEEEDNTYQIKTKPPQKNVQKIPSNNYDHEEDSSYQVKRTPPQQNMQRKMSNKYDEEDDNTYQARKQPSQQNTQKKPFNNHDEQEDNQYQVIKKPPLQSLQKKISSNYDDQQSSDKKTQPNRKPPVKSTVNASKKVEYHNYDSNPYNYDNPYDDEPAIATGIQEIPVPMYADPDDENQELIECPEGCGRRFNEKALDRHVNICQKVFQSKRKQFNTKEQRILNSEHATLLKQVQVKGKQDQQKQKKATNGPIEDKPIVVTKKPKWAAQSDAFRAQMKASSGQKLTNEESAAITQAQNQDLTQCNYCGRTFNETAAKKHISFCETKAKQNKMKNPPQKPLPSFNKSYK